MSTAALVPNRLAELVACLSGTPDSVARRALDRAGGDVDTGDPLAMVAGALVAIRRGGHGAP